MTRIKKLAVLFLALVIVAGCAVLTRKLNPEDDGTGAEETISVFSLNTEDVTKVSWTYADETITLIDAGEGWMLEEDSQFPLDESYLNTMLTTLSDIQATKTIESPEDLTQYGLEEPTCSVTVTAESVSKIVIGDETGLGGQRYLSVGDGNVYLVDSSILDSFAYGLYDIIQMETIPSMSDVRSFVTETENGKLEIEYLENSGLAYSDHYTWFAKDGDDDITLDSELTYDLVDTITDLSWDSCVDYKATASKLQEYGLADPAATVTVNYTETIREDTGETDKEGNPVYENKEADRSFVLELGNCENGYCYARLADSQMVYRISEEVYQTVVGANVSDLLPDDVLAIDWDDVTAIDIQLDGMEYNLKKETEETTDEEGNTSAQYVYQLDGETVEVTDTLDALQSLTASGRADGASASGDAVLSLVFHQDVENFSEVRLAFYSYDSKSYLVSLNGEARLLVSQDDLNSILEGAREVLAQ